MADADPAEGRLRSVNIGMPFTERVIEEGEVAAGDAWRRTVHRPDLPDVEAMAALQHGGGHDRELLGRILAAEPVPEGWHASARLARMAAGTA